MVSDQLYTQAALTLGKEPLVSTGKDAGWASELVQMQWWREKFPAPARNQTPVIQLTA